ncbi:putative leader peptide [Frankia sp. AgB1.8]
MPAPGGEPRARFLTTRRHIDLLRVASASCPAGPR